MVVQSRNPPPDYLHSHDFDGEWEPIIGSGRRQIALVCKECGMRVDEPRYFLDKKTGQTICGSLDRFPASCEEYSVQYVHDS